MTWNPTKTKTWDKNSPADGDDIDNEIDRIYTNLIHLKNLQGTFDHFFILPSLEKIILSSANPFLDISKDYSALSIANLPQLIPWLRDIKVEVGNEVSQFDVMAATKYDANSTVELELSGADATALIDDRLEDLLYNTDSVAINGALIDNWGMVVKAVTDIGDGPGKISAGTEMYVKLTNNDILNTLNSVGLKLGVQYSGGSNSIVTISGAKIEVYPFRAGISGGTSNADIARWRRVDDSVLRTGISGSRVRDQFQGHASAIGLIYTGYGYGIGSPPYIWDTGGSTLLPLVNDGINGDPRVGNRTRDRSLGVYLYLNAKEYAP